MVHLTRSEVDQTELCLDRAGSGERKQSQVILTGEEGRSKSYLETTRSQYN